MPVAGATLAGTLILPRGDGPFPAVVVISGSGPATRNGGRRFPIYRLIAGHLAARGIAVLLYDKRGVGGSTGTWKRETFAGRAEDVAALIGWLGRRGEIDRRRIGLIGHSQGGYVVPLVAQRAPVASLVMLAGPAESVRAQALTYEAVEASRRGVSAAAVRGRVRRLDLILRAASALGPLCRALGASYICYVVDYDPRPALSTLRVPVLALFGALDTQVPPDRNADALRAWLRDAGNDDVTIVTLPRANHWFAEAREGTTREFLAAGFAPRFAPGFLDTLSTWILARARP
ncbi:MAG: alpha/beta fold hydrolase [Armatimonadota bacterium]|nr:alpha/beta fold hydrolase [Armatimonadota bacterium]MDR7551896.1 alpha/beta fold hydrolase [Armatimonadota bacterium]MDR7557198.1 alpha/beta fold hydrolase [Armatimonadota bacterium]MDR7572039.1 alpha/beta fold hydrolase [Armatimonadota bacterium]